LKRAFAILMVTVMILPVLTRIMILIDFKINQEFIADVLCINKDEPVLMCSGKCYLSEQLKKVEGQEEKQAPTSNKERLEVIYYFSYSSFNSLKDAFHHLGKLQPAYKNELHPSIFVANIFHPPKLI
jgi:hypothetical protein